MADLVEEATARPESRPLLEPLGEIPSIKGLALQLTSLPESGDRGDINPLEWPLFAEQDCDELYIPTPNMLRAAAAIDRALRRALGAVEPGSVRCNASLYSVDAEGEVRKTPELGLMITGASGVGKSATVSRALSRYPQIFRHEALEGFKGPVDQVVWLYAQVPPKGNLKELARTLIREAADAVGDSGLVQRLTKGAANDPSEQLSRWQRWARGRFLGLLVLDEAQNLFRVAPTADRKRCGKSRVRVSEDLALKEVLSLFNRSGIALALIGTPDLRNALQYRMSVSQRLMRGGFFDLERFKTATDERFAKKLVPELAKIQYGPGGLQSSAELCKVIHRYTAGIHRLIAELWVHAHNVAAEHSTSPTLTR